MSSNRRRGNRRRTTHRGPATAPTGTNSAAPTPQPAVSRFELVDVTGCDISGCAEPALTDVDMPVLDDGAEIPYELCGEHLVAFLRTGPRPASVGGR